MTVHFDISKTDRGWAAGLTLPTRGSIDFYSCNGQGVTGMIEEGATPEGAIKAVSKKALKESSSQTCTPGTVGLAVFDQGLGQFKPLPDNEVVQLRKELEEIVAP